MDTFGEWLRQQRNHLQLTREQFAERVGCSVALLRKIEDGERRPSVQIAELMANCLSIPPEKRSTFVRVARGELNLERLSPEVKPAALSKASAPPLRVNLPVLPTPLIGRQREVEELSQLLHDSQCRLLTLAGPGGIGKTRLAIETASKMQADFADGVYFVPLAPVSSINAVISTIAIAIQFVFYSPSDPKVQLLNHLQGKQLFLLLDNLEHLLVGRSQQETVVGLLLEILQQAAQVKLLVTSRESLGVQDEWVFGVEGLPVPESIAAEGGARNTAVELFLQRARRAYVGFIATSVEFPAIVRICQMVEGNPLGIELAAAWIRTLSCDEISQEITRGLDILSITARDIPARHRSIRAVFDHSWKILTEEEQGVLLRLSAFRGGFRREAAEQVAEATLLMLSTLVMKSLIRRSGAGRYDLHELIRQFAAEQFARFPDEQSTAQTRHSAYYADVMHRLHHELVSMRQAEAVAEASAEIDNLRAAWQYAVTHQLVPVIQKFISCLWHFYEIRGWFKEGYDTFQWAMENMKSWPVTVNGEGRGVAILRADLLAHYAWFSMRLGQWGEAAKLTQECVVQLRSLEAWPELAEVLHLASVALWGVGKYEEARVILDEKISLDSKLGNTWDLAMGYGQSGLVYQGMGDYHKARELMRTAQKLIEECGDQRMVAVSFYHRSGVEFDLGEFDAAREMLEQSLKISTVVGDRWTMGTSRLQLGLIAQVQGEHEQAIHWFREAQEFCQETGERWSKVRTLNGLGISLLALDNDDEAGRVLHEALAAAVEAELWPYALDVLVSFSTWQMKRGAPEAALVTLVQVTRHPACSQNTSERASRVRIELEARLTPESIEAIQARAREKTFESVVDEILKQTNLA